jgi:hypothetical protein
MTSSSHNQCQEKVITANSMIVSLYLAMNKWIPYYDPVPYNPITMNMGIQDNTLQSIFKLGILVPKFSLKL